MKIEYCGRHSAVEVAELGDRVVALGDVIEVDEDLGARLLAQDRNWRKPTKKQTSAEE